MGLLMAFVVATMSGVPGVGGLGLATPAGVLVQDGGSSSLQGKERIVIHKDGGPGHGPDQPFSVREQGAKDLEGFLGGKYVVFEGGYDFLLLAILVVLIVVLIIVL